MSCIDPLIIILIAFITADDSGEDEKHRDVSTTVDLLALFPAVCELNADRKLRICL